MNEYNLEPMSGIDNYQYWRMCQQINIENTDELEYEPKISIVMPVYNTVDYQLTEAIDSVLNQSYTNYELILIDDHSSWESVREVLGIYENHDHVKVIYRSENGHISEATNSGIRESTGEFIAFMDCDDTLDRFALYEVVKKLNENKSFDFIYSDEDKISEDSKILHMPFFKPDWSPEYFMSVNYTNHLSVFRASIVKKIGGLRSEFNGSQDYDFTFRFLENTSDDKVGHIAKILYHWRERKESVALTAGAKNYAVDAAKRAKQDMLARRGIKGGVKYIAPISQYIINYKPIGRTKVSIIIPSKDHLSILKQCIDSIINHTSYKNYDITVVDNGSSVVNKRNISKYLESVGARYIHDTYDFNFSKMCNIGVRESRGKYVLLLNDDIEIVDDKWLEIMLGQAQQPGVGAVGIKLLYPNTKLIQHAGVSNIVEGPSHDFLMVDDTYPHYFCSSWVVRNCACVTGACLLIDRNKYNEVGGLDESLAVAYNDVDFCYKLLECGYRNVCRNDVYAYHHESLSRGLDVESEEKRARQFAEMDRMYEKHLKIKERDPYRNVNLHTNGEPLDLCLVSQKMTVAPYNTMDGAVLSGVGYLDAIIDLGGKYRLNGWQNDNVVEEEEAIERTLIVVAPDGVAYSVPVATTIRFDITQNFLSGFLTEICAEGLYFSLEDAKYGLLTVMGDGRKVFTHINWNKPQPPLSEDEWENRELLSFINRIERVYIYGAGVYGKRVLAKLRNLGIEPENYVVSDLGDISEPINGLEVIDSKSLYAKGNKEKIGVIMALKKAYREQVEPDFSAHGIYNVIGYPFNI